MGLNATNLLQNIHKRYAIMTLMSRTFAVPAVKSPVSIHGLSKHFLCVHVLTTTACAWGSVTAIHYSTTKCFVHIIHDSTDEISFDTIHSDI